jgi:HK97 family phage prohead protease
MKEEKKMKNKRLNDIKKNPKETRVAMDVSFRKDGEDEIMVIEGYFLKFNQRTLIGSKDYGFEEVILDTALNDTDMRKVPLKYNHNDGYLALASTKNGSLNLEVDSVGLKGRAELLNIQSHNDIYQMVESGLISECSFAFTLDSDNGSDWDFEKDVPLRTIRKIDRLYDVSIVDLGAYPDTEIYARSFEKLENIQKTLEDAEDKKNVLVRRLNIKIKIGGNLE